MVITEKILENIVFPVEELCFNWICFYWRYDWLL